MLLMHRLEMLPRWAFFHAAHPPESAKNA
jgi:hypothetical protein